MYSRMVPLFALNRIIFPANEEALLKHNNHHISRLFFKVTNQIAGKGTTFATYNKLAQYWNIKAFVKTTKKDYLSDWI